MCYEADIASAGGDKATLTKSLIIFLEDAVVLLSAGATGLVAVPELLCARRRKPGPRGTWRFRSYRGPW
jgi:hypothetical protein